MAELLVVGFLLPALCGSTMWWSVSQAKGTGAAAVAADVAKARLWASVAPSLLILVVIGAAVMALFAPGTGGVERLLTALASRPIVAGLLACAVAGLYPSSLCVRLWIERRSSVWQRLHLCLHVAATHAAILLLLVAPGS